MMELEQRVQALEQELQILKNQIQVMLLDIQEQVLSNTYPDLRSGDVPPADNRPAPRPQPEQGSQSRPSSPVHKVSFDDLSDDEKPVPSPKQTHHAPSQDMAGLEAWVTQKMQTIGAQETIDLIRMYGANGRFSPEVQDALLEFATFDSNYHDAPTQPSRPSVVHAAPPAPQNHPVKKAQPPAAAKPAKVKASAPPNAPAKEKAAKPKIVAAKAPDEGTHNIVLKLIAGVQNAGAGVRWGKHDG